MGARRLAAAGLAVLAAGPWTSVGAQEPPRDGRGDAVVVAIIDTGFTPYHWDYLAAKMPQHRDADPGNDLPLAEGPDTWLPGFPDPVGFASYNRLQLTLDDKNPNRSIASLDSADAAKWSGVKPSTKGAIHYYYLPGTKVVGMVDFEGARVHSNASDHGARTSSVAVGNLHGTCPECLLVFITYKPCPTENRTCPEKEDALSWAMSQPWIDAVSNSYGFSLVLRDRVYSGSDVRLERDASERGQTIFFSAGNGQANDFIVPNATLFSSQEGPDWIVTVSASDPQDGGTMSGAGKPADVTAPGLGYPSIGGSTVSGGGTFSGTSNATPVVAGMYATALHVARRSLAGASRAQSGGVVAVERPDPELGEAPFACGEVRPACELGDGVLRAPELRARLLHGAVHTAAGLNPGGFGSIPVTTQELEFLAEGHGTYEARLRSAEAWQGEEARITGPLLGTGPLTPRPEGEREWMTVDSYCRQGIWRPWTGGYFLATVTPLPPPSPDWPLRTALANACERTFPADHLPNLVPLPPFDLHVGSSDDGAQPAIRLSVSTANRGEFALELTGVPDAPPGPERFSTAYQCVVWTTHRACQNRRPAGRFVYHEEHLHYHFQDYALYELRRLLPNGEPDMTPAGLAAPGGKASFCLIDYDPDRPPPHPIYRFPHPLYLTCAAGFTGGVGVQGISPGWKDTYVSSLDGQQVLIEDVPDGRYAVVVTADPEDQLVETNESDNVSYARVELQGGEIEPD